MEEFFEELVGLTKELSVEEQRAVAERLSEEELAVFDLPTRPAPPLSEGEMGEVKKVARELLDVLKRETFVLEWRRKQAARAGVMVSLKDALDRLPAAYDKGMYEEKCEVGDEAEVSALVKQELHVAAWARSCLSATRFLA